MVGLVDGGRCWLLLTWSDWEGSHRRGMPLYIIIVLPCVTKVAQSRFFQLATCSTKMAQQTPTILHCVRKIFFGSRDAFCFWRRRPPPARYPSYFAFGQGFKGANGSPKLLLGPKQRPRGKGPRKARGAERSRPPRSYHRKVCYVVVI